MQLSSFIFRVIRWISKSARFLIKPILGWFFAHMSFAIPVKRLCETDSLIAFCHPRPSYTLHILLVPKMAIGDLSELSEHNQGFLMDLFHCVQELVGEYELEESGYRLIVNGGKYQEFPQLHFHLISDGKTQE